MVAKAAIQDPNLSLKATGLLAMLLSFPDTWQIHVSDLAKRKADGVFAIRAGLRELQQAGYVEKNTFRDDKGRFIRHEFLVHEYPLCSFPQVDNHTLLNTKRINKAASQNDGIPWQSNQVNLKSSYDAAMGLPVKEDSVRTVYRLDNN